MDQNMPPSPALSHHDVLHDGIPSGFGELLQHNSNTSYPRDGLGIDSIQVHSQPVSRYGTPMPQASHGYDAILYQNGMVGQYVGHVGNTGYHSMYLPVLPDLPSLPDLPDLPDHSSYAPIPEPSHPYGTPATSPPTPSRTSDVMTTRAGTVLRRSPANKAIAPRSGGVTKAKKAKAPRVKATKRIAKLEQPLTVLTVNLDVPVVDIGTYVNRSSDARRAEVDTGKNPGKVKRPMNAFMLYRKAYQERAKAWCAQHNHQIVSQVCGESWPLEPDTVRNQFTEWAKLERDNHQKAHPNYKFTPSKSNKQKVAKKMAEDSEGSDLDEFEWRQREASRNRSRTKTPADPDGDYRPSRHMYSSPYLMRPLEGLGLHQSAYDYSNPGKPMPAPYDGKLVIHPYYQSVHHSPMQRHGMMEDMLMRQTPSPGPAFQDSRPNGLPSYYDMTSSYHPMAHLMGQQKQRVEQDEQGQQQLQQLQQHQHYQPMPPLNQRIDPSLLGGHVSDPALMAQNDMHDIHSLFMDGGHDGLSSFLPEQLIGAEGAGLFEDPYRSLDETLSSDPHAQRVLQGDETSWEVQPLTEEASLDPSWSDEPGVKVDA